MKDQLRVRNVPRKLQLRVKKIADKKGQKLGSVYVEMMAEWCRQQNGKE